MKKFFVVTYFDQRQDFVENRYYTVAAVSEEDARNEMKEIWKVDNMENYNRIIEIEPWKKGMFIGQ